MHMPPTFPVRGSALQLSVAETLISIKAAVARQTAFGLYNTKNKQTNKQTPSQKRYGQLTCNQESSMNTLSYNDSQFVGGVRNTYKHNNFQFRTAYKEKKINRNKQTEKSKQTNKQTNQLGTYKSCNA